jgi:pimeloyl-ACP methyl ester carboxylesterase
MRALILAAALAAGLQFAAAHEFDRVTLPSGSVIDYVLVLPEGYDPARSYEMLLAFPGGDQSLSRAISTVERFWEPEAPRRGVIVVAPAAPSTGRPFFMGEGSIRQVGDLVAALRTRYAVADGKIHLAGHSNGGISAFRAAIRFPELFESMTVIAGVPSEWQDFDRLARLQGIRINLFVGANDRDWRSAMVVTQERLTELGIASSFTVVPRSGHLLEEMAFDKSGPVFDTVVAAPATEAATNSR